MPTKRQAISAVVAMVVVILIVAVAGVGGYLLLSQRGGSPTTTSNTSSQSTSAGSLTSTQGSTSSSSGSPTTSTSQASTSTSVQTNSSTVETSISTQTQSGSPAILNTFTNGDEILGNFSQLTLATDVYCSGSCQTGSNGTVTDYMSYVGNVQNGSFSYRNYNFTLMSQGFGSNASTVTMTALLYLNESNPAHSYYVTEGSTSQVNASSSDPDEDGILIALGAHVGYGFPEIWLPYLPVQGQPQLVNQTNSNLGGVELLIKTYEFSLSTTQPNPQTNQQVNGTTTFVATFATIQGTNMTFCSGWTIRFVANDQSFTEGSTYRLTSLQRA